MTILFDALPALFGAGAAAAGTAGAAATTAGSVATTAATTAGIAGSGISLSSILQGTATVLGIVASLGAGAAEADALEAQAIDAEREKPLETLQGINRRQSIRRDFADAIAAQDVAYAGSGVDLSFGTARQARSDAAREADLGIAVDVGTETTRISRLSERAASYRRSAKRARRSGVLNAVMGGLDTVSSFMERG
jgi:hypothetical protein